MRRSAGVVTLLITAIAALAAPPTATADDKVPLGGGPFAAIEAALGPGKFCPHFAHNFPWAADLK